MIGPVIGHVPCALDHQRRIREARAERVSRAVAQVGRRSRARGTGRGEDLPGLVRGPAGEDVWQALRF
jgi:hypothetical protein